MGVTHEVDGMNTPADASPHRGDASAGGTDEALAGLDIHPVRPKQQHNTSLNTNTRLSDKSNPRNTTRRHRGEYTHLAQRNSDTSVTHAMLILGSYLDAPT